LSGLPTHSRILPYCRLGRWTPVSLTTDTVGHGASTLLPDLAVCMASSDARSTIDASSLAVAMASPSALCA
ncbi:MAG TPA: hypothetical protein PLF68_12525, partial [Nitrospira sp.]|nr:hypothetical protein [Nitrospira sp.]